ncbi:MAG TPA: DegQ family serine endoprotease [Steroidobacteraceae bacterium]|nr:DegQ family serine endoprotease [Steroidobacteraceae bacterium]
MKPVTSSLLTCAMAALLVGGCKPTVDADSLQIPQAVSSSALPVKESAGPAKATLVSGFPDFSSLVDRYGDSVVNVEVVGSVQRETAGEGEGMSDDDPLSDFFRRFGMPGPGSGDAPQGPSIMHGTGSGFIVSKDGYILTNAHVVQEADEVTVRLTDRREFPAKVIGSDARTDVAVIKIDAKTDLPAARIGNPNMLKTGEWVLAIGSPFGLDNTATAGIVSSTARSVGGGSAIPFIQTDVAVNPGNSGGPLFDLAGEVIGINSMIFSQSGGYMGISFAVPIDIAMQVREQLIKTGHVVRGRIGVGVQDVDASLARSFELDRPRGALVSFVDPEGPAKKAGLKPGDVVLEVNDKPVEQSAQLSNAIAAITPGGEARLQVWRGGKQQNVNVHVEQLDEPETRTAQAEKSHKSEEDAKLGLVVRPLSREEKRSVGTEGSLVVEDVQGPAARAGLQPGDVILAVNNHDIHSTRDLRDVAAKLRRGDAAALLVERGGNQIFVPLRVS